MILDDPQTYKNLDPSRMGDRIGDLADQCRWAWQEASSLDLPKTYRRVERVVVAGMGGSAIGGDLMADLASLEKAPPITSCRDYSLPTWVDPQTLVIVSSYSGETEEALSTFHEALDVGAGVVAMTQGGRLKELARAAGAPVLDVGNGRMPRAALGYGLIGLVGLLSNLGLLKDKSQEVEEAAKTLEECLALWDRPIPGEKNGAKQLTCELHGHLVVIYGAGVLTTVARRWKTQFNENAKTWAYFETLPELNHNAVEGYPFPSGIRDRAFVVLLSSSYSHPRIKLRYSVTQDVLAEVGIKHRLIESRGESPLSQMLSTILLGDYASYYLALLNGVDPSPTKVLDSLKKRLQFATDL